MSNPHQVVTYDRASQRIVCPHRDEAVPSGSVTVQIIDSAATEKIAATSATKGAFSTTLGAAAAAGDRSLTVAATTSAAVGEPIVVTDTHGRKETHIIEGVSGTTVYLRDKLSRGYPITSTTVKSAHIYYDLDASTEATWPTATGYQAVFNCSTWSSPRIVLFRIVDAPTSNPIELDDVRRWLPHVSGLADSYDQAGAADSRDMAWEIIRTRIEAAGRDPEVLRGERQIRSAGGLLAAALFCLAHGQTEMARQLAGDPLGEGGLFASHWGATVKTLGWFDEDQDRAVDAGETRALATHTLRRSL